VINGLQLIIEMVLVPECIEFHVYYWKKSLLDIKSYAIHFKASCRNGNAPYRDTAYPFCNWVFPIRYWYGCCAAHCAMKDKIMTAQIFYTFGLRNTMFYFRIRWLQKWRCFSTVSVRYMPWQKILMKEWE
jgi:hypothetical protein